ncbi:MAG: hypothetical protein QOJ40_1067 [Verrucomicrobiota bacterium]
MNTQRSIVPWSGMIFVSTATLKIGLLRIQLVVGSNWQCLKVYVRSSVVGWSFLDVFRICSFKPITVSADHDGATLVDAFMGIAQEAGSAGERTSLFRLVAHSTTTPRIGLANKAEKLMPRKPLGKIGSFFLRSGRRTLDLGPWTSCHAVKNPDPPKKNLSLISNSLQNPRPKLSGLPPLFSLPRYR